MKLSESFQTPVATITLALSAYATTPAAAQQATAVIPYNQTFVTKHTGVFGGERISYTATVAPTILTDSAGQPAVNFVSYAYVRDGVRDVTNRPVIFGFAGGPSSSSSAYHMRMLGPRRIVDPAPGHEAEGQRIVDNPDGVLDVADVVLVDPAGTGFTRILPAGKQTYFYSINGDVASIEQFITEWLRANGREASPRYVMGGSYGSVRVIRIGWDFQRAGQPVDGIIMTANSSMQQETNGALLDATNLPTFTMVALYHGKVARGGRTDAQIAEEAYRFAMREYLGALSTVQDMTQAERAAWAAKLQTWTGISAQYFLANDLAISRQRFMTELLKDRGLVLTSNYDGRLVGPSPSPAPPGERGGRGAGPVAAAQQELRPNLFHTYLRDELKVTYPMNEYAGSAPNTRGWNYDGPPQARRPDGGNDWPRMLRELMEKDPNVRVYSANGYQDMQSTMGQAAYIFSRTRLPRDRIVVHNNVGGHALYTDLLSAAAIAQDLRKMLAARRPR